MTEDNRIREIRAVLAEPWGDDGYTDFLEGKLARIRVALDNPQPAPRVFFPGDTVPAEVRAVNEYGVVFWTGPGDLIAGQQLVEIAVPTSKEWQAAVDRAVNERPGLCDGCDRTDAIVGASDDGRGQFCPRCLPGANEVARASEERAIPDPTEGQNRDE